MEIMFGIQNIIRCCFFFPLRSSGYGLSNSIRYSAYGTRNQKCQKPQEPGWFGQIYKNETDELEQASPSTKNARIQQPP